jgi:hypothetical protein
MAGARQQVITTNRRTTMVDAIFDRQHRRVLSRLHRTLHRRRRIPHQSRKITTAKQISIAVSSRFLFNWFHLFHFPFSCNLLCASVSWATAGKLCVRCAVSNKRHASKLNEMSPPRAPACASFSLLFSTSSAFLSETGQQIMHTTNGRVILNLFVVLAGWSCYQLSPFGAECMAAPPPYAPCPELSLHHQFLFTRAIRMA